MTCIIASKAAPYHRSLTWVTSLHFTPYITLWPIVLSCILCPSCSVLVYYTITGMCLFVCALCDTVTRTLAASSFFMHTFIRVISVGAHAYACIIIMPCLINTHQKHSFPMPTMWTTLLFHQVNEPNSGHSSVPCKLRK